MRNYNDPEYKKARLSALRRDGFKCKICKSKIKCQVHHIRKFADAPSSRNDINNLITLCKKHHRNMWQTEESFAAYCFSLIHPNSNIYNILKEYENNEGTKEV